MPQVAKSVRVIGRVQGVFFRQSAVDKALELGIGGWVRNRADGSVDVYVEGEPDAVEVMLSWLRRGPAHAEIDTVQISEAEPENSVHFEIRR